MTVAGTAGMPDRRLSWRPVRSGDYTAILQDPNSFTFEYKRRRYVNASQQLRGLGWLEDQGRREIVFDAGDGYVVFDRSTTPASELERGRWRQAGSRVWFEPQATFRRD